MKKAKKKVKGMTLIEMIITIMIFSLMCGILVMIGTHIDSVTRSTNTIKDKMVKQSPYAANGNTSYIGTDSMSHDFPTSDMDITLSWDGSWSDGSSPAPGFDIEFEAKRFMTQDVVLDGRTEKSKEYITNGPNAGDTTEQGRNLVLALHQIAASSNADLVFRPTLTLSDSTMGNVGYWDPTSDPANPTWVPNALTVSHVPDQFEYVYNESTGEWEPWRVVMVTATCRVGREEETVNTFISIQPDQDIWDDVEHKKKVKIKGGGGSEVKGLQEAGGADFQNGGNIYGGLGVNLADAQNA